VAAKWRKSAFVDQNSAIHKVSRISTKQCSLTCQILNRKDSSEGISSRLFPHHKELARQTQIAETWQIRSSNMRAIDAKAAIRDPQMRVLIERSFLLGFDFHPMGTLSDNLRECASMITSSLVGKRISSTLAFAAHLSPPMEIVNPPTVDFGFVFVATTVTQIPTLTNEFSCPNCLTTDYPQTSE
jgi:hypothetical protein